MAMLSLMLLHASGTAAAAVVSLRPPRTQVTPSEWHRQRRRDILDAHPEVRSLIGQDATTLPCLAAVNLAQLGACLAASQLPLFELVPTAVLVGGTLSLWQFALLHDIKHGTAALPNGLSRDHVVFWGALPSLFGYFYGHRVGSPSLVLHTREVRLSIRISQSPLSETVFGAFRCP